MINLEDLNKELADYKSQQEQMKNMFQQLTGAILVLESQIKRQKAAEMAKIAKDENEQANNEAAQESA